MGQEGVLPGAEGRGEPRSARLIDGFGGRALRLVLVLWMAIVIFVKWVVMGSPGLSLIVQSNEEIRRFLYFFLWAPYSG